MLQHEHRGVQSDLAMCKLFEETVKNKTYALLPKEALEKAKTDAKMLKTSFWPPLRKGRAVEAIASFPLSCI